MRRVILALELETDIPTNILRNCKNLTLYTFRDGIDGMEPVDILQAQANVVKTVRSSRSKEKKK